MTRFYDSITETFDFGRYSGYKIAEVLCQNPSYLHWCINNISQFCISKRFVDEIRENFPDFIIQYNFKSHIVTRDEYCQMLQDEEERNDYDWSDDWEKNYDDWSDDSSTYERYCGSYAQDEMGYSDDDIDTIFDGDPDAYWNID